jgi:hypothetical protein
LVAADPASDCGDRVADGGAATPDYGHNAENGLTQNNLDIKRLRGTLEKAEWSNSDHFRTGPERDAQTAFAGVNTFQGNNSVWRGPTAVSFQVSAAFAPSRPANRDDTGPAPVGCQVQTPNNRGATPIQTSVIIDEPV